MFNTDPRSLDGSVTHALFPRQSQTGSNRGGGSNSLSGMVSTLVPVFLISSLIFLVFVIASPRLPRVYQPRTYLETLYTRQRSPKQSSGVLGWRKEYSWMQDDFVLGHSSIDNYLWLRFFKMLCLMCLVGCFITWPVLFPVNATGGGTQSGLDILSFSNVTPGPRYYAQAFVAWAFLAWVMFLVTRESFYFMHLRQRFVMSPSEASRISTKTILFVNVPEEARSEGFLRKEFAHVHSVWLVDIPDELADKVEERDKAATKLEAGETKLLKNFVKRRMKQKKKGEVDRAQIQPDGRQAAIDVHQKDRPTHRLPVLKFLPLGKKVNTLDWSRGELRRLIPEVAREQEKKRNDRSEPKGACFVEFETVEDAQAVFKNAGIKRKAKMTPAEIGTHPDDVIWKNAVKPFARVQAMNIVCTAFIWFLCIFWSIPVAVIGAISNINYLTENVSFLSFIDSIPPVILGVVTGLLPVLLLSVLMALVPIVCKILASLFEPTQSRVQLKVQGWYFPFQVIQVFLITTFASGASSVASQIVSDPTQAVTLLAQNLPKASNFYISYFILFGLMTAAMQVLNLVPLLFFLVLGRILDTTPRKMYNRYVNLGGLGWGSLYPKFTNLGVIALAYSSIAPLVLGFATVGFALLYFAFRYNILFTMGTETSTRGESYKRALQQLTTGLYLSELCLIGLFAIGVAQTRQSIGPLVLMIVFLVGTILWHIWLNRRLGKMEDELPSQIRSEGWMGQTSNGDHHTPATTTHQDQNGTHLASSEYDNAAAEKLPNPSYQPPAGKKSIKQRITGFLHPTSSAKEDLYSVSDNLSSPLRPYTKEEHDEAYLHPATTSECQIIWIPRDKYGLSKQEVQTTKHTVGEDLIAMTDEEAWFDEKGKVQWRHEDEGSLRNAPIWEDRPNY
ncbi:hypothetical protein Q7P37_000349 [Cladosporium fusiforme]